MVATVSWAPAVDPARRDAARPPDATAQGESVAGPTLPSATVALDAYVPARVRTHLEQTYYARVNAQTALTRLVQDPTFLDDPYGHVALFSDHGIVHVRDIAARILSVLDAINGVCIPPRSRECLEGFMMSYGVLLAYLHDIGMADLSPRGRAAHAAFVAQAVFTPALDAVAEAVWEENSGGIAARLRDLAARGALAQAPTTVWREMLALASAHSKSSVPCAVLDDPARLRRVMQVTLSTDLRVLSRDREPGGAATVHGACGPDGPAALAAPTARSVDLDALATRRPQALRRYYADVKREAFRWLVCAHPDVRELVNDVVDTVRALRCADALRQRGTTLKTSGAYEVFVEQATAQAVYGLRTGPDHLFLLRLPDPLSAGEANLAHTRLSPAGDLHITFHRGAFATPEAVEWAAHAAAAVVDDVERDVLGSLAPPRRRGQRGDGRGAGCPGAVADAATPHVVLEGVADNPAFAHLVRKQLLRRNPRLRGRVRTTPAAPEAAPVDGVGAEEARYAAAPALDWDRARRQATLERIAATGHRVPAGDPRAAFQGAKVVTLRAGETLIAAGTPATLVYIPLADGLTVLPLGGYPPTTVGAGVPVGHTGVIRGAPRNATVVARRALSLLMLPGAVYLRWWHQPYGAAELRARLTQPRGAAPECGTAGCLA